MIELEADLKFLNRNPFKFYGVDCKGAHRALLKAKAELSAAEATEIRRLQQKARL